MSDTSSDQQWAPPGASSAADSAGFAAPSLPAVSGDASPAVPTLPDLRSAQAAPPAHPTQTEQPAHSAQTAHPAPAAHPVQPAHVVQSGVPTLPPHIAGPPPVTGPPPVPGLPRLPGSPPVPGSPLVPGPSAATLPMANQGPGAFAPPMPPGGVADFTFDAEPPKRRRSKMAVAGALVGVFALGTAGVFAASQFGGSNDGGESSPESVGTAFMASLEQEDVLGMVDLLLPGERETFRQPMVDIVAELSRLEVLSSDASLADLSGFDFELSNELTTVSATNVSDIANITMRADMTATLRGDELPVGDLVTDYMPDDFDMSSLNESDDNIDLELPMTVVEEDGRWYLSLFYTLAETLRHDLGEPIPAQGIAPQGGATPEGAIDLLLDAAEQLDVEKLIAGIDPTEAQALQRYAPLFIEEAQWVIDEAPANFKVTNREYVVEGSGSERFVEVISFDVEGVVDGEPFTMQYASGCGIFDIAGQHIDSCDVQQQALDLDDMFSDSAPIRNLIEEVQAAFADYDPPGLTVREVDGQWFVSPVDSGFEQMLALLRALDRDELDRIVLRTQEFVNALLNDLGSIFGSDFGDDFAVDFGDEFGDEFVDDPFGDDPFGDDPFGDDANGGGGAVIIDEPTIGADVGNEQLDAFEEQSRIATDCYALSGVDAVAGCLQENIDAGALPGYFLGIELKYPECGVSELALGQVPLYQMSDADYTAMIAQASTCFGALIESGSLQQSEVPAEYLRPDCGEGRNPWNYDQGDQEAAFDAWLECVYS